FVPDGYVMPRDRDHLTSTLDSIDEGFFPAMGISILQGRAFERSDTADSARVAIVNEQFATHYWPGENAVGKRLHLDSAIGPLVEVVGVAQTVQYRQTFENPADFVYLPQTQHPVPPL